MTKLKEQNNYKEKVKKKKNIYIFINFPEFSF